MLREITIGQYYATDSLLHRLDPRVKIAGTLLYIISLFLVHHYIGLVVAALIFGVMVRMSNVPFRFIVKGLKPIMMMLVFTALLHLFCTPGKAIFSLGVLHITIEGVQKCIFLTVRLTLMMIGSPYCDFATLYTLTPNGRNVFFKASNRVSDISYTNIFLLILRFPSPINILSALILIPWLAQSVLHWHGLLTL